MPFYVTLDQIKIPSSSIVSYLDKTLHTIAKGSIDDEIGNNMMQIFHVCAIIAAYAYTYTDSLRHQLIALPSYTEKIQYDS